MVAKSGGYFGVPFKGHRGVTKGGPLSPMIFNVVLDAVLYHCITMVEAIEDTAHPKTDGFGRYIQWMAAYSFADKIILASTQAHLLQRVFDVLTELFGQVGLCTNAGKTVSMAYQPC